MLSGKQKLFPKIFLSEMKKMKKPINKFSDKTDATFVSSKTLPLIQ